MNEEKTISSNRGSRGSGVPDARAAVTGSSDVGQTFLSAGSRDIPVPCFTGAVSKHWPTLGLATGKSPEPADRNFCPASPARLHSPAIGRWPWGAGGLCLAAFAANAQLHVLPDEEPQQVFSGDARTIAIRVRNEGNAPAAADLRSQLYQASATTAAPLGDTPWKRLQILPGQTIVESATLNFPDVKAETRFLVRWLAGTNRVPGTTQVLVYPTNPLAELTSLAAQEALGVFDPGDQLKPLLRRATVAFTDLEDAGVATFRGKLAILGPFSKKMDVPPDLARRVEEMAGKGVAAVWLQPPPGPRDKLQPSFYTMPWGTNAVVVAQASLVTKLAESPRSQWNLLELCRAALRPQPPRLPQGHPDP